MIENTPPAKILVPVEIKAFTVELALGFHAVMEPVEIFMAAALIRDCPPIVVKLPPA
jgi:hypothetical protein